MKRSVGVTVIAVLSLIGSLLTLLLGLLMVFAFALASSSTPIEPPIPPGFVKVMLAVVLVIYLGAAAWGIATSIGLLNLRNWARLSIIVFSALLVLMSGFSGLMLLSAPMFPNPSEANPSVIAAVRIFMGAFWLAQLAIGIWWLVFFNRAKVKQQFVPAGSPLPPPASAILAAQPPQVSVPPITPSRPQRPLSLTILAWFVLAACLFLPLNVALHSPAFMLTKILTGRPAVLYYLAVVALHLYIGIGLLRLKPLARTLGVGYFTFAFINAAVFYLAPGARARMQQLFDSQFTMFPWMRAWQSQWQTQFNPMPSFVVGAFFGLALLAVPLYFLITRKQAFEKASASLTAAS